MPNEKNIVKFSLEGIGPFSNRLRFVFDGGDNKSIKLGIYATNGTGKTFISRCFSECSTRLSGGTSYYPKENLVSFGKTDGKFDLEVQIKNGVSCKIVMPINNISASNITSGVIFHVFNSDYIKRQFMARHWAPDGDINGEIVVGEENAKVATLIEEVAQKYTENEEIKCRLDAIIGDKKLGLKSNYDVRANSSAFQGINFDSIIKGVAFHSKKTKLELVQEYDSLKEFAKISDAFQDVSFLSKLDVEIEPVLIDAELNKSYARKDIQEKFLAKIQSSQDFIRKGLTLTKDNKCPYCEQSLDGAKEIITAYNDFFDKTQVEVSNRLSKHKSKFEKLESDIKSLMVNSAKSTKQFNDLKGYFPSTKDLIITPIVLPDGLLDAITLCKNIIQTKIEDISCVGISIASAFMTVQRELKNINNQVVNINTEIKKVNDAKESLTSELKTIKDSLCEAEFNDIISVNRNDINKFIENHVRIKAANEEIQELQTKKPKKDLVYKEFCDLIKTYFGDKYTIESDTFKLKLNTQSLDNPDMVLSDGEKSIIAFCYYLADIHSKINSTADYDKLFFVIDDPISSMDFTYVYETAQVIKNLTKIINGEKPKYIILTHNAEFMNILCSNSLLSKSYHLKKVDNEIMPLKHAFVAPYQNHLEDIYSISQGRTKPTHTTYNSIRHILESIKSFVNPDCKDLDEFIDTQTVNGKKLFESNGHMYRVIHDMSHGRPRNYEDISEDKTIDGCKELIKYINEKFPGQIPHIQNKKELES